MKASVIAEVTARDKGCVAPLIDPASGPCYDRWGRPMARSEIDKCEIDHFDWQGRGKDRAEATAQQVVMGCAGHHRGEGPNRGRQWMTAHRPELRAWVTFRAKTLDTDAAAP